MSDTTRTLDIAHLARLAALRFDAAEQTHLRNDLERIIAMVDVMAGVDTDNVEPLRNPLDAHMVLRPDEVTEQVERAAFQAVAPESSDGFYLVPRVVE